MEIVKPCLKNLANLYYFQGLDDEGMAEPEGDEPMAEEPSMGDMWVEVNRKGFKTIPCTLPEIVLDPIRKDPSARLV